MSSKESENSAALRVLNLRKTYKTAAAPALDGVTFEVGQVNPNRHRCRPRQTRCGKRLHTRPRHGQRTALYQNGSGHRATGNHVRSVFHRKRNIASAKRVLRHPSQRHLDFHVDLKVGAFRQNKRKSLTPIGRHEASRSDCTGTRSQASGHHSRRAHGRR